MHKCSVAISSPTNDSIIVWHGVPQSGEKLTDSCDNSPGKEEGGADVPQAGLIERIS